MRHVSCQPQPAPVLECTDLPPWGQGITESIQSPLQTNTAEGLPGSVSQNTYLISLLTTRKLYHQRNSFTFGHEMKSLTLPTLIMGSAIRCQWKTLEKDHCNTEDSSITSLCLSPETAVSGVLKINHHMSTCLAFLTKRKSVTMMQRIQECTSNQLCGRV